MELFLQNVGRSDKDEKVWDSLFGLKTWYLILRPLEHIKAELALGVFLSSLIEKGSALDITDPSIRYFALFSLSLSLFSNPMLQSSSCLILQVERRRPRSKIRMLNCWCMLAAHLTVQCTANHRDNPASNKFNQLKNIVFLLWKVIGS